MLRITRLFTLAFFMGIAPHLHAAEKPEKPDPVEITVEQRTTKIIPNTNGELRISLGDITAGKVMVTVYRITGEGTKDEKREALVPATSMRLFSTVTFTWNGHPRELVMIKMVNSLLGVDYAAFEFRVKKEKAPENKKEADTPTPPTTEV